MSDDAKDSMDLVRRLCSMAGRRLLSLRLHNLLHARLALIVAIVFFTAGLFYRRQT